MEIGENYQLWRQYLFDSARTCWKSLSAYGKEHRKENSHGHCQTITAILFQATIDISAKKLFDKSVTGVNEMSQWNPTVIESRKLCVSLLAKKKTDSHLNSRFIFIQTIDNHTDITYQVSAPAAGGLIKSRDFVSLRSCHTMKNGEIIKTNDIYKSKSNASILSFKTLQERQKSKRTNRKSKKEKDEIATLSISSMGGKTFSSDFIDKSDSSDEDTDEEVVDLNGQSSSRQGDSEELSYVISATGIEYSKMSPVPQYIRYVST